MALDKSKLDDLRIDRDAHSGKSFPWMIVIITGIIAVVVFYWLKQKQEPQVAIVKTAAVVARGSNDGGDTVLDATGYVVARRKATVSSKVTGKVVSVAIEEGMSVPKGQVLARLEDSNQQANLALTQARLKAAGSALAETMVRIREAKLDLNRARTLLDQKVGTQANFDSAQAQLQSLEAILERQKDEITVVEQEVAVRQQDIEDTIIRAPFSGVVISKDAQPGEMISPVSAGGGFTRTGIGTLVDMSSLEIEVDVNESYINRVKANQTVTATLDAWPNLPIAARVIAIVPTADRQKATVRVRIAIEQKDQRILPDMGVKVAFQSEDAATNEVTNWLEIPEAALDQDGATQLVWVLANGVVERRAVNVTSISGGRVRIDAGVKAGERVIIGPTNLKDGDKVQESES